MGCHGSVLYNLFINDLFLFVENSDTCKFANDNTLSVADLSIEYIIKRQSKISKYKKRKTFRSYNRL